MAIADFTGFSSFRDSAESGESGESGEYDHTERVLAAARILLAAAAFIAIYIDPTDPTRYAALTYGLLLTYILYSVGVLVFLTFIITPVRFQVPICAADILWVALLTAFTQGPNSPFFVFFTFVLVASAYRWGFRETFATGMLSSGLLTVEGVFFAPGGGATGLVEGSYELNRFIMGPAYLVIITVLLGYLAQADKRAKAETSLIARAMAKAQAELGLNQTIEGVLGEILQFYGSDRALLAVIDSLSGRAYLVNYEDRMDTLRKVRISELQPDAQPAYLFDSVAHAWFLSRIEHGGAKTVAMDDHGKHLHNLAIRLSDCFLVAHPFKSMLSARMVFGEELSGRLYILDPVLHGSRETEVHFIQRFTRAVSHSIYNVYLWRRIRSKVGAMERARIARDLHDGVLQSLVGLELQIGHHQELMSGQDRPTMREIYVFLQNEIRNLRELVTRLRSVDLRPGEMVPFLVDVVERFGRDTGIASRFVCDSEDIILRPRVCSEITAIVQEALANVRKHSGARNVLVRFACSAGVWTLFIEDDGCGFDFDGKLSLTDLDETRKGPVIIKERVRLLKGELVIESTPGAGSRLIISAPIRPCDT